MDEEKLLIAILELATEFEFDVVTPKEDIENISYFTISLLDKQIIVS